MGLREFYEQQTEEKIFGKEKCKVETQAVKIYIYKGRTLEFKADFGDIHNGDVERIFKLSAVDDSGFNYSAE